MTEPFGRGKYSKQLREADERFRALEAQCDRALAERNEKIAALVKSLEAISAMDPEGIRADDLGRAARLAADALRVCVGGALRQGERS